MVDSKMDDHIKAPRTNEKGVCFVMMPFGEEFDHFYKDIYVPAIKTADLDPVRADDIKMPGVIITQVWENITTASALIADVTDHNPNVMFELGLALAINRPVVLVINNGADNIPFDLTALRHIIYNKQDASWRETLCDDLKQYLENAIIKPKAPNLFRKIDDITDFLTLLDKIPSDVESRLTYLHQRVNVSCHNLGDSTRFDKIHEDTISAVASIREAAQPSATKTLSKNERYYENAVATCMEKVLSNFITKYRQSLDSSKRDKKRGEIGFLPFPFGSFPFVIPTKQARSKSKDPFDQFTEAIGEWKTNDWPSYCNELVREVTESWKL
jgi:hypothetical protein